MSALRPLYDSIRELDTCDLQQLLRWSVQAQLLDFPGYSLQPSAMAEDGMTRIKYLEKADTREGLMEEAKSFRYCAAKVDAAFERVRKGLEKVDASDYKDKDGKPIQKLQPTWVGYQRVSLAISKCHLAAINWGIKLSAGGLFFGVPVR